jgi:transposase-like protein
MSKKELNQAIILDKVKMRSVSFKDASTQLHISERQLRRKRIIYQQAGPSGLMHQSRGKPSNRKLKSAFVEQIRTLIQERYADMNITLMTEYLADNHQISVNHETLRRILIQHGTHVVKKRTARREHVWREAKHHRGELIQFDGSLHKWFNDEYSTLLLCVDDATGEIYAEFATESVEGVMGIVTRYLRKHGRPHAFYTDRGGVYKVNTGADKETKTQFGRALTELDIELIHARSPQAKGRVERAFRTIQDRLCHMLKQEQITTLEQAKSCLTRFTTSYNRKFSRVPKSPNSFFRSLIRYDLNTVMCLKHPRKIHNGRILKFNGKTLLVDQFNQPQIVRAGSTVTVYHYLDGTFALHQKGHWLKYTDITTQQPIRDATENLLYTDLRPWEISIRNRTFLKRIKTDISKEF